MHENAPLRTIIIMEIWILEKIDLKQVELVALEDDPSIMEFIHIFIHLDVDV